MADPTSDSSSAKSVTSATKEAVSTPPDPKPLRQDESESARLCNKWVESGLAKNKAIQFLVQTLDDLGCTPPSGFIHCRTCEQPQASGFGKVVIDNGSGNDCQTTLRDFQSALDAQKKQQATNGNGTSDTENSASSPIKLQPEIFVCQQYMENEVHTHKSMVHELIHAIDFCRTKMDPVNNCLHLACTEIRAENLSGECGFWKELPRMKSFQGHGGECVKRRAMLSVRANPKCAPRAQEYVEATMPRCFVDNFPFERHPNQQQ